MTVRRIDACPTKIIRSRLWAANSQYEGIRLCGAAFRGTAVMVTVRFMHERLILSFHLFVTA
jgi:hypothetical protein